MNKKLLFFNIKREKSVNFLIMIKSSKKKLKWQKLKTNLIKKEFFFFKSR
jgi:hypothetical protein